MSSSQLATTLEPWLTNAEGRGAQLVVRELIGEVQIIITIGLDATAQTMQLFWLPSGSYKF